MKILLLFGVLLASSGVLPLSVESHGMHSDIDAPTLRRMGRGVSEQPKPGHIYSCSNSFSGNHSSALFGEWVAEEEGYYDISLKPIVDQDITWDASVSITADGTKRYIRSNGLPTHGTGRFPVGVNDDVYAYDRSLRRITAQQTEIILPKNPVPTEPSCLEYGAVGIALNGVAIYLGVDAFGRDAQAYEVHDACGGHPSPEGEYHYHTISPCIDDPLDTSSHSSLIGYAFDGFGIFGNVSGGRHVTNQDLDVCHGHTHVITWDDLRTTMYHYHVTDEFPYTLGCYRALPQVIRGERAGIEKHHPTAFAACNGKLHYSSCFFPMNQHTIVGICQYTTTQELVCVAPKW